MNWFLKLFIIENMDRNYLSQCVFNISLFSHTVRKSQIVSKYSIFKKTHESWLWIWIFVPKYFNFVNFLNARFAWIIWIFAPKIVISCKCTESTILTIFGVKIQIFEKWTNEKKRKVNKWKKKEKVWIFAPKLKIINLKVQFLAQKFKYLKY